MCTTKVVGFWQTFEWISWWRSVEVDLKSHEALTTADDDSRETSRSARDSHSMTSHLNQHPVYKNSRYYKHNIPRLRYNVCERLTRVHVCCCHCCRAVIGEADQQCGQGFHRSYKASNNTNIPTPVSIAPRTRSPSICRPSCLTSHLLLWRQFCRCCRVFRCRCEHREIRQHLTTFQTSIVILQWYKATPS